MLMTGLAQDADILQLAAHFGSGLTVLLRQAVTQNPVGVAQLEALDRFGMIQTPALEVVQRLGALLQGLVVVVDDRGKLFLIVGIGG